MSDTTKTIDMADTVLLTSDGYALLALRAYDPHRGMWALPGGRIEPGESPAEAAARELKEETGVHVAYDLLREVGVYDEPGRDPRGPYRTTAHTLTLPSKKPLWSGSDADMAAWWPLSKLPGLAFDHAAIIAGAVALARSSS